MITALIVVAIVAAALFSIYFFNLDMKLVAVIYNGLNKRFDKQKRVERL